MIKVLRFVAVTLSLAVAGAMALPANAMAPGIIPIVVIAVSTAAGPVSAVTEEMIDSIGIAGSETRAKAKKALESADWDKAKTIQISLEDDIMNPAWIRMKAGQPYIFEIKNGDGDSGTLRAPQFFAEAGTNDSTLGLVHVGAAETRKVRVIAVNQGTYDMDMGPFTDLWGYIGKIEVY